MTTTPTDVLLDSTTGDLPDFCRLATGPEVIRQKVQIRLNTAQGDWFLDASQGIPYHTWLSTKPFQPEVVSAALRNEVATTTGVITVTSWNYTWDVTTRLFTATGMVQIQGVTASIPIQVAIFPDEGNAYPRVLFPFSVL